MDSQTRVSKKNYLSQLLAKKDFKAVQKTEKGFEIIGVTTKTFVPPDENMVYFLANDLVAQKSISGTDDEAPTIAYEKQVVSLPLQTFYTLFEKNIMQKGDTKAKKTVFTLNENSLALQCRDLFLIYNLITAEVYFKKYPTEFLSNEISEDAKLEIAQERIKSIRKVNLGTLALNMSQVLHIPEVFLPSQDADLTSILPAYLKNQLGL